MIRILAENNHLKELYHQIFHIISVSLRGVDILYWMWIAPGTITIFRCYEGGPWTLKALILRHGLYQGRSGHKEDQKAYETDETFSSKEILLTCGV